MIAKESGRGTSPTGTDIANNSMNYKEANTLPANPFEP
jgi:hypothetical protein